MNFEQPFQEGVEFIHSVAFSETEWQPCKDREGHVLLSLVMELERSDRCGIFSRRCCCSTIEVCVNLTLSSCPVFRADLIQAGGWSSPTPQELVREKKEKEECDNPFEAKFSFSDSLGRHIESRVPKVARKIQTTPIINLVSFSRHLDLISGIIVFLSVSSRSSFT